MAELSANLFDPCLPVIHTDIDRCGSLTACQIAATTAADIETIFKDADGNFRVLWALFESHIIGKSCGIKENPIAEWIKATRKTVTRGAGGQYNPQRTQHGLWNFFPFVLMEQRNPINNIHWKLTSGDDTPGTFNGDAYDYSALVESMTGIPAHPDYFPARLRVHVSAKSAGGSATRTEYEVVGSELAGSNRVRIYALDRNAGSLLDADKLEAPVTGVLKRGTVEVRATEKFCSQIPPINNLNEVPFFLEEVRWTMCQDDLVDQLIDALLQGNKLYERFLHEDSVAYNRRMLEDQETRDVESFFYNKGLPNQDMNNWGSLEKLYFYSSSSDYIYLPGIEGRCVGRRAHSVGQYELLSACGQVNDLQGNKLQLQEFFRKALYDLIRIRRDNDIPMKSGPNGPIVEGWTDSFFVKQFAQSILRYYKDQSEGLLRVNMQLEQAGPQKSPLGFYWRSFAIDYPPCEIRLMWHQAFDDLVSAHKTADATLETAGRNLWFLDPTTMYEAVLTSNRVMNKSGSIQELAAISPDHMCVMDVPRKSQTLLSKVRTFVNECPKASLILENFDVEVPAHGSPTGDYEDLYEQPS